MLEPSAPWVRLGGVKPKEWSDGHACNDDRGPCRPNAGAGQSRRTHARRRRMDAAAAWRVDVDYEVMPAVFDPRAAMRPAAPLLHDDGASYAGAPLDVL